MSAPLLVLCDHDSDGSFYPLSDTRAVFQLRVGILTLRERVEACLGRSCDAFLVRPELEAAFREQACPVNLGWSALPEGAEVLLVDGRVLATPEWAKRVAALRPGQALADELGPCTLRPTPAQLLEFRRHGGSWGWPGADSEIVGAAGARVVVPWDLIRLNPGWIELDAAHSGLGFHAGEVSEYAELVRPDHIHLGTGSVVEPFCFLDASGGPIVISPGAVARSHTRIEGPAYIGPGSELLGGRIGEGTSLGPGCKIAGEIEESVVLGYSSKRHQGFVGHSYLGEWVNLGALTTTSDLKNNYGPVRMWNRGEMRDTGLMKLGAVIGDHVKTAIGTLLGTGTVVGAMSNVFRVSPPRHVPHFRWVGEGSDEVHRWEKAAPLLSVVMGRRKQPAGRAYVALFEALARRSGA